MKQNGKRSAVARRRTNPVDVTGHLSDTKRITTAIRSAVRAALREHKRAGNPIAVWRRGKVVWIPPEKIRA